MNVVVIFMYMGLYIAMVLFKEKSLVECCNDLYIITL